MIPGYLAWKQRLAYAGDPEQDFVCVQMDSVEITQGAYKHRFDTYFHESEPGFDPTHPDSDALAGDPARQHLDPGHAASHTSTRRAGSTAPSGRAGP